MKHSYIRAIGSSIPKNVVSNDELINRHNLDSSDEWIYSHTGIRQRFMADNNEPTSTLATKAAESAIASAQKHYLDFSKENIDGIIVATTTPDFLSFPSTACIVHNKLELTRDIMAFDISSACAGFVYALETARNYIMSEACSNILVIGAEVMSGILNYQDRGTCILFGDGAGAAIVSAKNTDLPNVSGICQAFLGARGSGIEHLSVPVGGVANPYTAETRLLPKQIVMNGRQVYVFAVDIIIRAIRHVMNTHSLSIDDIAYIVPHQANKRIIEAASKRLKVPMEKFYCNIERYANTSSASIPIALWEMEQEGLLHRGDKIIIASFGAGLSFGAMCLVW